MKRSFLPIGDGIRSASLAIVWLLALLVAREPAAAVDLFTEGAYAGHKPDLHNGELLANAAGCIGCHASDADAKVMSGGLRMDTFIGTFFAPNITSSTIGGWSGAQFLNAVMFGVAPDGRNIYPVMPYVAYAGMNPTDVLDIKAYLATLPKSEFRPDDRRVSFPFNLGSTISAWKRYNLTTPAFRPAETSQLERGRYLVENVGACGECHTPRTRLFRRDDARRFTGGKIATGLFAPDITSARVKSLGPDAFGRALFGAATKLDGSPYANGVMRHMAQGLGKLDEADQRAIVAYLSGSEIALPKLASSAEAACRDHSSVAVLDGAGGNKVLARAADNFIGTYCRNCHGPGESDQGSYPASDLASVAADTHFVTPGDRNASALFSVVKSGRMPKGAHPSHDEIEQLGQWIDSLKSSPAVAQAASPPPRARSIVPIRTISEGALHDFATIADFDKPFVRYFSFVPQYNGAVPCENEAAFKRRLSLLKAGFHKLLNSLSLGPKLIKPEAVAATKELVVRVDIRDLGWTSAKWHLIEAAYPYALDPYGDPSLGALAKGMRTDVPILRADWFMANSPKPSLYYPLLDLPDNISGVERRLGVDAAADIRELRVKRAAFLEGSSGVSDHNRMIERHDTAQGGYYWKSYDFSSSVEAQSLTKHPHGPADVPLPENLTPFKHAGGEMIFTLPNGMQGYYLSKADGDRLDEGPTQIVSFRQRPIGKGIIVVNARSCFDCHSDGVIAKRDQLRDVFKSSGAFDADQLDVLLKMYVSQPDLTGLYDVDRAVFVAALSRIDAAERAPDGSLKARSGPNNEESVTYFADLYEATLDEDELAAEFDLTREEFDVAIQRLDGNALKIVLDWLNQVKAGARIPRDEVEAEFPILAKPLLRVAALKRASAYASSTTDTPLALPDYKVAQHAVPDPASPSAAHADRLALAVQVPTTKVVVNDKLSFDVIANKACELQILYVDSNDKITELPSSMIGERFLQARTPRHIPADGDIVFDGAGSNEALILACREGGLGDARVSEEQARTIARGSHLPPTRSIALHFSPSRPSVAKSPGYTAPAPSGGPGPDYRASTVATQVLTFDVRKYP